MASNGMTYIPNFVKIILLVHKLNGDKHTQLGDLSQIFLLIKVNGESKVVPVLN